MERKPVSIRQEGIEVFPVTWKSASFRNAKEERVENANACEADIYVSIHQNTFEDSNVEGIETWYDGSNSGKDSKRLAQLIHQEPFLFHPKQGHFPIYSLQLFLSLLSG